MSSNNTLSEKRDIVVSRIGFIVLCGVAVLLLVAVLVLWFGDSDGPPHPFSKSGLATTLAAEETAFVAVVSSKSEFSLFDPDKGEPIPRCGQNSGTSFPSACNFKNKIKDLRDIGILTVIGYENDDCQLVTDTNGTYDVHYRRPHRGRSPCGHVSH